MQTSCENVCLIGADIGTTTAKAGAFTYDGRLIRESEIGYDNRVDPGSWWQALAKAIAEVVPQDDPLGDIAGISVGSQGPSLIALGKNQEVLCPALMWNDLRAKAEAENLSAELGRFVSPAWFLPKAIWLKDHHPQMYSKTRWFLQAMDYAALKLTRNATAGIASSAIAAWSDKEVSASGLDSSKFPPILKMGEPVGEVTPEASRITGLPSETPVFSGAPDFVESILGTATVEKGLVCDKAGTSEGVEMCWDRPIPGFFCAPHPVSPDLWHIGVSIASTGLCLDWLASILEISVQEAVNLAEEAPPGSKGLVFLPHLTEERSSLFAGARGGFLNFTLDHGRADLSRSVMEGCALAIHRALLAMREEGAEVLEIRTTGGQSRSGLWNQTKADVTGLEIMRTEAVHGEVTGAAAIAAFGSGLYPNLKAASVGMARFSKRYRPYHLEAYSSIKALTDEVYNL